MENQAFAQEKTLAHLYASVEKVARVLRWKSHFTWASALKFAWALHRKENILYIAFKKQDGELRNAFITDIAVLTNKEGRPYLDFIELDATNSSNYTPMYEYGKPKRRKAIIETIYYAEILEHSKLWEMMLTKHRAKFPKRKPLKLK